MLFVRHPFDEASYWEKDALARKRAHVALITSAMEHVGARYDLPPSMFTQAAGAIEALGYVNEWSSRPIASRGRRLRALLRCTHDIDRFVADLVVWRKTGEEVSSTRVVDGGPDEWEWVPKLGKLKWQEDAVEMVAKDGTVLAHVAVPLPG